MCSQLYKMTTVILHRMNEIADITITMYSVRVSFLHRIKLMMELIIAKNKFTMFKLININSW